MCTSSWWLWLTHEQAQKFSHICVCLWGSCSRLGEAVWTDPSRSGMQVCFKVVVIYIAWHKQWALASGNLQRVCRIAWAVSLRTCCGAVVQRSRCTSFSSLSLLTYILALPASFIWIVASGFSSCSNKPFGTTHHPNLSHHCSSWDFDVHNKNYQCISVAIT